VLIGCAAGLGGAGTDGQIQAQNRDEAQVLISVVDKDGEPFTALSPDELTVREGGQAREVLRVEAARGPMHIALLADTSPAAAGAIPDLRAAFKALGAEIREQSPDSPIALYAFGDRPMLLAEYSTSGDALAVHADRLFTAPNNRDMMVPNSSRGGRAYFMDAVVEAAADLEQRRAQRAVLIGYVDENGPESSSRSRDAVSDAVAAAHASLWVVVQQGEAGNLLIARNPERARVLGDVPAQSGGRSATVHSSRGIQPQFRKIAAQLLSQLVVTYRRTAPLTSPVKLEVRPTNADFRVAAPSRVWR